MSRARIGAQPMSAAERQARRRARLREVAAAPLAMPRPHRLGSRPQRWAAAVDTLIALQGQYQDWLDRLPEALRGSTLADKLEAIAELDLEALQAIELPRGYGRD